MATLETIIGWLSVQDAIAIWPDAPGEPEDGYAELVNLMGTAHEFLEGKGPKLDPPPERYKTAQILYMQHIYARKRTGNGDTMGAEGFQLSTFPLVQEALGYMKMAGRDTPKPPPGKHRIRGLR